MSKDKRRPKGAAPHAGQERVAERDTKGDRQDLLGNQAMASRGAQPASERSGLTAARDIAVPLLERSTLALQMVSRGAEEVARYVQILEQSTLPRAQRQALVDRLQTDEAVARDIGEATRATFGADGEAIRDQAVRTLDAVADALREGEPDGARWRLPDGRSVSVGDGGVQGVMTAVGDGISAQGDGPTGAAILAFCQRVHLAALFDEEEEPLDTDYGTDPAG